VVRLSHRVGCAAIYLPLNEESSPKPKEGAHPVPPSKTGVTLNEVSPPDLYSIVDELGGKTAIIIWSFSIQKYGDEIAAYG